MLSEIVSAKYQWVGVTSKLSAGSNIDVHKTA